MIFQYFKFETFSFVRCTLFSFRVVREFVFRHIFQHIDLLCSFHFCREPLPPLTTTRGSAVRLFLGVPLSRSLRLVLVLFRTTTRQTLTQLVAG